MMEQDLVIEVAPDELGQPGRRAEAAGFHARVRRTGRRADRDGAETQVHGQVRGPLHGREVARLGVGVDALEKLVEQPVAAAGAGGDAQLVQVGAPEAERLERRHFGPAARRRQRAEVWFHRIGAQLERVELPQPGVLVGREHGERLAAAGHDLATLEDHLVLERVQGPAGIAQRRRDAIIANDRRGLVVMVGEDRVDAEFIGQRHDCLAGAAVAHDQRAAVGAQQLVELGQRVMDELDPPVLGAARGEQRIEDVAIEDERAIHAARLLERVIQRRVVVEPQVTAEPDEGRVHQTGGAASHCAAGAGD